MSAFKFDQLSESDIQLLQNGGIGVIPTDTVYGVVTQASNHESVKRLYALKNRIGKPGTIITANIQQLLYMGVEQHYIEKTNKFWPGPTSIIIPVGDSLSYLHQGKNSLAFRVVSNPEIAKLLNITGPLLTSSANHPGEPVANTIAEAKKYFGDSIDFYIDGGDLSNTKSSKIIEIAKTEIKTIRN